MGFSGIYYSPLQAQAGVPGIPLISRYLLSPEPVPQQTPSSRYLCSTLGNSRAPPSTSTLTRGLGLDASCLSNLVPLLLTSILRRRASNDTSYEHVRLIVPSQESLLTPSYPMKGPAPNSLTSKPTVQHNLTCLHRRLRPHGLLSPGLVQDLLSDTTFHFPHSCRAPSSLSSSSCSSG